MTESSIKITVNGRKRLLNVKPYDTLSKVLREYLGLTGTKRGCDYGGCGCCTVIMDGKAVYSCMMPAIHADGTEITTIEGLEKDGTLHPLQESFIKNGGFQCGYCTPGFIMSAKALLDQNPEPSEEEIREAVVGNLCRCTGYNSIITSVKEAGKILKERRD